MKTRRPRGFTLLEMLTVVGLVAAMSIVFVGGLGGGGDAAALEAAQATLANLITAGRTQAPATGRKTRLLVAADPGDPARFLRQCTLQLARQPGSSPADWDTVTEVNLPEGTYVLPAALGSVPGLVAAPPLWKRESDRTVDLCSDLFQGQTIAVQFPGEAAPRVCLGVAFTPNATLAAVGTGPPPKGYVVIAVGRRRPPGTFAAGESPVVLPNPESVRGLVLSAYGVPALLNERRAF